MILSWEFHYRHFSLPLHVYLLVEIAFQVCTSYRLDLPEHRPIIGWFPCVPSGNGPEDEESKQPKGSLQREDEVWLKVSDPNVFLCENWIDCACVCVCVCVCVYK